MIIHKVSEIELKQNPHGVEARQLANNDKIIIMHLTLKPGDTIKPHSGSGGACFYVLEGSGIVTIGDEKMEVEPDTLIESPKGSDHGWINKGNSDLKLIVIRMTG